MSNMPNSNKSSSFNMGNGGMGAPPPKQFNIQNIHVVKPAGPGEGVFPGGMGMMNQNTQRSNDTGMNSQRQSRLNPNMSGGFPTNDYSTAVPSNMNTPNKNMNKQMRPQSTDPHRMNNIQAHNFGMTNSQMRSNDDNFFGNSGMKGNPAPSMNNDNEDFDWGM